MSCQNQFLVIYRAWGGLEREQKKMCTQQVYTLNIECALPRHDVHYSCSCALKVGFIQKNSSTHNKLWLRLVKHHIKTEFCTSCNTPNITKACWDWQPSYCYIILRDQQKFMEVLREWKGMPACVLPHHGPGFVSCITKDEFTNTHNTHIHTPKHYTTVPFRLFRTCF